MMEVQTFFLAGRIRYDQRTHHYTASMVPAFSFTPEDAQFPFHLEVEWLLVMRRSSASGSQDFSLRLQMTDPSGVVLEHNTTRAIGNFADAQRFMVRHGTAHYMFPTPGDYRIDLIADESTIYSYDIEVTSEPREHG